VLDGGASRIGVESTIVDATDPAHLKILRPGAISARDLRDALGGGARRVRVSHLRRAIPSVATAAPAPGMLEQHYSPRTPLELRQRIGRKEAMGANGVGLIYWRKPAKASRGSAWLTRAGDPAEAARRLYAVLRRMDAGGFGRLLAERAPKTAGAWGEAINDRLSRAAAKRLSE
jgi:L-threonylcarbamoyladenylate synthase